MSGRYIIVRCPIGWYRIQAGSVFHHSPVARNQYGAGTFGDIVRNRERRVLFWLFAFCSIMVLYLVGMADDLIGIRYRAKFVIQILCGVMLIAGGVYINTYTVFWASMRCRYG